MLFLVVGFISNKDNAIKESAYKQLDFGSGLVSQEVKTGGVGLLSLTKSTRPGLSTLTSNKQIADNYEICLNFSAILPQNIEISYQDATIHDTSFIPVYSFDKQHVNHSLLSFGAFPNSNSLSEVIINQKALEIMTSTLNKSPLNESFSINHSVDVQYVTEDEDYITDTFHFNKETTVVGVVNELNYLATPKIYYSYSALIEYMKELILENLSTYNNMDITWYDRVFSAENHSPISSFSYMLFLKDISNKEFAFRKDVFINGLSFSSSSITLGDSLFNFMQVAEYGLVLFLVITLLGTLIILCIVSFTSFSEDQRSCAILTSIGATESHIEDIYVQESFLNELIAFVISIFTSFGISKLVNYLIGRFIDVNELISIPFLSFLGIKFLFPILTLAVIVMIVLFSTLIPISLNKRKTIKARVR